MDGAFLDWAREALSGSVAAEALSAGPYCVLAAVDHRQDTRMLDAVLDHAPTHDDLTALLGRLQGALDARDVARKGSTTEGSALSPAPIRAVCGEGPQQLGTFPGIAALVTGVVSAVAAERERVATSQPTLQRGRPAAQDKAARRLARTSTAMHQQSSALFQERF